MDFVHPQVMIAAAGLALAPIVIHFINRRRYRREPWAAMEFLLAAHRMTRRRMQFEQWLLMAVRCLAILLLGLTVARPLAGGAALIGQFGQPRCDRVIVLDDSLSMQARRADAAQAPSAFEAAKNRALAIVDGAGSGDGLAVMTASSLGRTWMQQPVYDRQAVRGIVESLRPTAGMNDLPGGLKRAAEILSRGAAAEGNRIIYLISDWTAASLEGAGNVHPSSSADRVRVIDAGPERRDNLSVTSFRCEGPIIGVRIPARFSVAVANHGERPVASVQVEVQLDGAVYRRLTLGSVPAGQSASQEFDLAMPRPGSHRLVAQIVPDDGNPLNDVLPADDVRTLAVQVAETVNILLVEGRPTAPRASQELLFYATAVCPDVETGVGAGFIRGTTVSAAELTDQKLSDSSVIVLGNVGRLAPEAWKRLGAFVRDGGGLLIFLGDQVQPASYNWKSEGERSGPSILPFNLGERYSPAASDAHEEPPRLQIADALHPVLADLAHHDKGGLRQAYVQSYWEVEPVEETPPYRTLLRLSNGRPALTVHRVGGGRIAVMTMAAGMTDSNLPAKPDYPPLMLNLTAYLATGKEDELNGLVGGLITTAAQPNQPETANVVMPDGRRAPVEVERSADSTSRIVLRDTRQPGFYVIEHGPRRREFSINPDITDSNLKGADPKLVKTYFGGRAELVNETEGRMAHAEFDAARELASPLAIALLACVVIESILATWFGARK